ncbi:unnamed protein product [Amoebophrya sp. A120]|nr:unnamed protein product [Amoebophrya sp. A120]|eukprot:GSA120T00001586001.1
MTLSSALAGCWKSTTSVCCLRTCGSPGSMRGPPPGFSLVGVLAPLSRNGTTVLHAPVLGGDATGSSSTPSWLKIAASRSLFTLSPARWWGKRPTRYSKLQREVKTEYPPKRRSKVCRLPIHSKLCFVTDGWYYKEDEQFNTPILCFAKAQTHSQLDHLTEKECYKLVEMVPELLKEFERCEKELPEYEAADKSRCLPLVL